MVCMPQDQTDSEERISGTGYMPVGAACSAVQECARSYDSDVRNANRRDAGRGICAYLVRENYISHKPKTLLVGTTSG